MLFVDFFDSLAYPAQAAWLLSIEAIIRKCDAACSEAARFMCAHAAVLHTVACPL